jgi:FAD:protein FMN transferase
MTQRSSRAKALLGTMVVIHLVHEENANSAHLFEQAFAAIELIQARMSAHDPRSDLARLSASSANNVISIHPWTYDVLKLAHDWQQKSGGAFDPCLAAHQLHRKRPGLTKHNQGTLADLVFLCNHQVRIKKPLMIDLGGIAKGFAVDKAVETLKNAGISSGLIDAGGDLRAWGEIPWHCEVRHAQHHLRDGLLFRSATQSIGKHFRQGALATSVNSPINPDFVLTHRTMRPQWQSATIFAPDCVTADVLTKWALQSSLLCPALQRTLRQCHARMWRSS